MKDLEWIKKSNITHRGLHTKDIPENTLASFRNAVKYNYDIEFDIHLTLDNRIVVVHDHNLKRLCNKDIVVEKATYKELKKLRILNTKERIPLLQDVLEMIPDTTKLLIEFKRNRRHKVFVEKFMSIISNYPHTYAMHSFDPRIVNQFKKQAPEVIRGIISQNYKRGGLMKYGLKTLKLNFWYQPDFVNYHFEDLPNKYLDTLHQKGMCIISYTVHSKIDLEYVRERYDNAVFENFLI